MVQSYIKTVSSHGALVNSSLALAAGKALIQKYLKAVGNIDIDSSSWTKSLFKRMGYVRWMKTSSKVKIPDGTRREIEFLFHHEIITTIEKHNVSGSMIIDINQTPLKYVHTTNFTLVEKEATSVTMEGGSDKTWTTGTFRITFSNKFSPMQVTYGGKTVQTFPCFKLPEEFSLSANPAHFSNSSEFTKLFEEVTIPYFQKEQKKLNLSPIQKYLRSLTTIICLANIPLNMTKYYQPLDLTVNGHVT